MVVVSQEPMGAFPDLMAASVRPMVDFPLLMVAFRAILLRRFTAARRDSEDSLPVE